MVLLRVFIPGWNSSWNLWVCQELLCQGRKECLFLGKRKGGRSQTGVLGSWTESERGRKIICEAEKSSVRQKCHLVIERRSSGGGWGHNIRIKVVSPSQNVFNLWIKEIWRKSVENSRIFTSGWHKLPNQTKNPQTFLALRIPVFNPTFKWELNFLLHYLIINQVTINYQI